MSAQAEDQSPEPRRPFRDFIDRVKATADASTAESMRQLRQSLSAMAFLDSPWLLLIVPTLPALRAFLALGDFAFLQENIILAMAVALAGRRFGTAALTPTLLLCLLELVQFRWLPGVGDLATIPLLLVAARVGYDPGFLAGLQRCTVLTRIDYLLLMSLALVSFWQIGAFEPDFNIFAGTNSVLLATFIMLGAANVSRRILLIPVAGFAMHLLLAQLAWNGPFFVWSFGTYVSAPLACVALFEAGRSVRTGRAEPDAGITVVVTATHFALCLIFFLFAVFQARLQYPLPAFQLNGPRVTSLTSVSAPLAPSLLVMAMAVSAWCRVRHNRRLAIPIFVLMGGALLVVLGPAGELARQIPRPDGGGFALSFDQASTSPRADAVVLLLLCAGAILAVERWQPRHAQPAPLLSGSFMVTLLGRFWSGAAALQAVFLLALAGALALAGPFPQTIGRGNTTDILKP